jgi:integrase
MLFDDLFDLYVKDLTRRKAKTIDKIESLYHKNIQASLGNKKVKDIIRGDIATLHFEISDRAPYVANKCLGIIKAMYNLAITLSIVDINPSTNIGKNRETKRKRYLNNDELLKVIAELDKLQHLNKYKKSVAFIKLLIFTGARCGEIANAKWSDIDNNILVIKDHKTDKLGEDRLIHITPLVQEVLDTLDKNSYYILGIKSPRRVWEKIKNIVGLKDIRLHDIRHSYASWSLQKINLSEVGNLLGHRDQATTQRYAHIHQDQAILNANKVGAHIENLIKDSQYQR